MSQKIAVLGLGWLGLPLAKSLFAKGHEVKGSTTSSEKLMRLLQSQFSVRIIKADEKKIDGNWKAFSNGQDVLIINIPPKRIPDIEDIYPLIIRQIALQCPSDLKVIFISSTSVYGNSNGKVTEDTDPNPEKRSGKAVLAAEKIIQRYFENRATIIRFAGLMGPNRHPGRFVLSDDALENPEGKINMIHLEDCIELITRVIEQDRFGEIFNGCASEHPNRKSFYTKVAYDLSINPPVFKENGESKYKIVDNSKSLTELQMKYKYNNPENILTD